MKYITIVNDQEFIIEVDQDNSITVNGQRRDINFQELSGSGVLSLLLDNHSVEALVEEREGSLWEVLIHGELYSVLVQDERSYRLAKARGSAVDVVGDAVVKSPMPGLIISVAVDVGQQVNKGDALVILESMKMENELHSPRTGRVIAIHTAAGKSVEKGQPLVTVGDKTGE